MKASVDIHNVLSEKNIPHEVIPLSYPITSTQKMAAILNIPPTEIVKSVLFIADKEPVLTLLSGDKRVSYKKLKRAVEASNVRIATGQEVVDFTGYMLGATPPIAHKIVLRTVMDLNLKARDVIYTSAGEPSVILKMRSSDLENVTGAQVYDLTDD
ncbi:MAG TPA: hypothetical protein ENN38_07250 [Actinobacteria bacterium]|nr:hypothetical protein [Actinomycetota bacterium]